MLLKLIINLIIKGMIFKKLFIPKDSNGQKEELTVVIKEVK